MISTPVILLTMLNKEIAENDREFKVRIEIYIEESRSSKAVDTALGYQIIREQQGQIGCSWKGLGEMAGIVLYLT